MATTACMSFALSSLLPRLPNNFLVLSASPGSQIPGEVLACRFEFEALCPSTTARLLKQLRYLTFWTPLRGEESVIGRSDYCSIPIRHPSVSRLHASITHHGERTFVRDLGSRNGTFLNGERVGDAPVPMELGDVVRIGSVECILESSRENAQATADDSNLELWDRARPS